MSEIRKPEVLKRIVALIIDGVIAAFLNLIPMIGALACLTYLLVRDGLDFEFMKKRSVGKQILNLKPIMIDGGEVSISSSMKRNWPIALIILARFLIYIPLLGWFLMLVSLVIGMIELIRVFADDEGRRWGDKLAGTKVVEIVE